LRRNEVWRTPLNAMAPVLVGTIPETFWGIESVLWATTGDILAAAASGLWRLPSQGGDPSVVVPLDSALRERMSALSTLDDRRILVSIADSATSRLATIDLDTWQLTRTDEEGPGWYTRGWLLRRGPTHFGARRFDRGTLRTSGEQVAIEGTLGGPATFRWYSMLAVSSGGSAAWFATAEPPREMTWVDTTGRAAPLSQQQPLAFIRWPRVAHDGKRIAFKPEGGLLDVLDLVTGALITLARREGSEPVWLPDGSGIITSMGNRPNHGLVLWPADGRPEQVLLKPAYEPWPTSLSTDGRSLLYYGDAGGPTGEDLFVMDLSTKSSRRIERPGGQRGARFSPDGRWIAYQSEVGGRYQVEVVPWPAADARYVVSVEGGTEPLWSGDSRAIYFRNGDRVMVARVLGGPTFATTPPQELFTGPYLHDPFGDQSWDRAPDGRFLMVRSAETPHIEVRMIRNLPAWLERRERGEP